MKDMNDIWTLSEGIPAWQILGQGTSNNKVNAKLIDTNTIFISSMQISKYRYANQFSIFALFNKTTMNYKTFS